MHSLNRTAGGISSLASNSQASASTSQASASTSQISASTSQISASTSQISASTSQISASTSKPDSRNGASSTRTSTSKPKSRAGTSTHTSTSKTKSRARASTRASTSKAKSRAAASTRGSDSDDPIITYCSLDVASTSTSNSKTGTRVDFSTILNSKRETFAERPFLSTLSYRDNVIARANQFFASTSDADKFISTVNYHSVMNFKRFLMLTSNSEAGDSKLASNSKTATNAAGPSTQTSNSKSATNDAGPSTQTSNSKATTSAAVVSTQTLNTKSVINDAGPSTSNSKTTMSAAGASTQTSNSNPTTSSAGVFTQASRLKTVTNVAGASTQTLNSQSKKRTIEARGLRSRPCKKPRTSPIQSSSQANATEQSASVLIGNIIEICRLCNKNSPTNKWLHVPDLYKDTYHPTIEEIYELFNVKVGPNDIIQKICEGCIADLKEMHDARLVAKCSSEVLKGFFSKMAITDVSPEKPEDDFEIIIKPKQIKTSEVQSSKNSQTSCCTQVTTKLGSSNCPICIHDQKLLPPNDKLILCPKHERSYTCLVPNCVLVFTNNSAFIKHYREHKQINKRRLYICHKCYGILGPRKNMKNRHQHQTTLAQCCYRRYTSMSKLVLHKIISHKAKIIRKSSYSDKNIDCSTISNCININQPESNNDQSVVNILRSKIFTCTVPECSMVYDVKKKNHHHYRKHADVSQEFSTCSNCLKDHLLVDGCRPPCDHKNINIQCTMCNITFDALHGLAYHKLTIHSAVILCGDLSIPGCPVCSIVFDSIINPTAHYKSCFTKPIPPVNNDIGGLVKQEKKVVTGSVKCQFCDLRFYSVSEYVKHSKKAHQVSYMAKDNGIRLCPLCNLNYDIKVFVDHVGKCIESMLVSTTNGNCYECVSCSCYFTNLTPRQFRNHVMFCQTFKTFTVGGKDYHECINCNFVSIDKDSCTEHATGTCVFYELKTRYAMFDNEKQVVDNCTKLHYIYSKMDIGLPLSGCVFTGKYQNVNEELKLVCDSRRCKLLNGYNYFCVNCSRRFFCKTVFENHTKGNKEKCRSEKQWYCEKCVVDFLLKSDFDAHVENNRTDVPQSIPINSTKDEKTLHTIKDEKTLHTIKDEKTLHTIEDENTSCVIKDENTSCVIKDENAQIFCIIKDEGTENNTDIFTYTIKEQPDIKCEPDDLDVYSYTNTYTASENNITGCIENGISPYGVPAPNTFDLDEEQVNEMNLEFDVYSYDIKPKIEQIELEESTDIFNFN